MLNDSQIRKALIAGDIGIVPFVSEQVQPVSYDLTLSKDVRIPRNDVQVIRTRKWDGYTENAQYYGEVPAWKNHTKEMEIHPSGQTLRSGSFVLGCAEEYICLSSSMAARVEGKSSLGRLGVAVHITAGFIDPGFKGQITLEIVNLAPWDVELYPGMPIAQIVFEPVDAPDRDYTQTGRYNGQRGPTESRYGLEG
jgi:dCTP deaminase